MTDDFASKITRTIAERGIHPRPRLWFLATRAAFWSLTGFSTLLGAIGVSTLIFVIADRRRTGGANIDEMPLDDLFEILPWAWLAFLLLAATSATLACRATPRGYLRRPRNVFAATLLLSVLAGTVLHLTGTGPALNRTLANTFPGYSRLVTVQDWRKLSPDQGRLAGSALGLTESGQLLLRDFRGRNWIVTVTGATLTLDQALGSDEDLDITGTRTGPSTFVGAAITEWH